MDEWKKQEIDRFIGSEKVLGRIGGKNPPPGGRQHPFERGEGDVLTRFRELVETMSPEEASYASPSIPVLGECGLGSAHVVIIRNSTTILHTLAEKHTECFKKVLEFLPRLKGLADNSHSKVCELASLLVRFLEDGDPSSIATLARAIQVAEGAIFIIGAGISYASRMFLTSELAPIVRWFLKQQGITDPREVWDNNPDKAWGIIKTQPQALMSFKDLVREMVDAKPFSTAHQSLVRIFGTRVQSQVISLNWDNFIERVYLNEFNRKIAKINRDGESNGHALWKLQGDVDDPTTEWILPHEEGVVFQSLTKTLFSQSGSPWLPVVIVGYSECDAAVTGELIDPLSEHTDIWRIGPEVPYEKIRGVRGEAEKVLPALQERLRNAT